MERRSLRAGLIGGLVVVASSMLLMAGTASAHTVIPQGNVAEAANCKMKSLPGLMRQGELVNVGSVGDVVEIECNPNIYPGGTPVEISDSQLYDRCNQTTFGFGTVRWATLLDPIQEGRTAYGLLDGDGNLTVDLLAGPNCAVGGTVISANTLPFGGNTVVESFSAAFAVEPAKPSAEGVTVMPSEQVEDEITSSASTLVQAEFGSTEAKLRVASPEVNARCELLEEGGNIFFRPGFHLNSNDEPEPTGEFVYAKELAGGYNKVDPSGYEAIATDNDGNAFVIDIGFGSCKPGKSYIQVDEEQGPFNTEEVPFTILPPQPTEY